MSKPTLFEIFTSHQGKVSDKWDLYLREYDRLFSAYRTAPLRLLEIGIQNGGSLDIWADYFAPGSTLVGCDINPDCAALVYDNPAISFILGDANDPAVVEQVLRRAPVFDLIIDDGSHTSGDIVKTFTLYFQHLADGGLFVAEDLHCSYWEQYQGGLYDPYSSLSFFKRLSDVISHQHWGIARERKAILQGIFGHYGCDIDEAVLTSIHSVEFINSLCIVRKAPAEENVLGRRIVTGSDERVVPGILQLHNTEYVHGVAFDQSANPWSLRLQAPDEALPAVEQQLSALQQSYADLQQSYADLQQSYADLQQSQTDLQQRHSGLQQRHADQVAVQHQYAASQRQQIATLRQQLSTSISQTTAVRQEVAQRDERAAALQQVLVQKEEQIATLQQALAQSEERVAEIQQILVQRDERVADVQQTLTQRDIEIAALRSSSSWRATAGLRFVGTQVLRAKRAVRLVRSAVRMGGGLPATAAKAAEAYRRDGIAGLQRGAALVEAVQSGNPSGVPVAAGEPDRNDYAAWLHRYDVLDDERRAALRTRQEFFAVQPLISVVMPTYNPKPGWLVEVIESVRQQIYPHWELCIADDCSSNAEIRTILERYQREDSRIKVVFRPKNGHISAASNSAIEVATGDWIALLDHDDLLSEQALFWVAEAINQKPDARLIYSDEDKIDADGVRFGAYFKTDWNRPLFYSQNMISHLGVYHAALVREVGGFQVGMEGSQDYDLALRCIERIEDHQIHHIARVLYHWRVHQESTAMSSDAKPYAQMAGERALTAHFARRGVNATVERVKDSYRVRYALPDHPPLVSLIIPTRNGLELLRTCVQSVLALTTYPNYEILIVDNGSDDPATLDWLRDVQGDQRVRVLRDDRPFNYSALNNGAVRHARGELLGLLNNDLEVITPDWLDEMVSHALQPGIGAVGARLWYPDNTLQHGGVIVGLGGVAGHAHVHMARQHDGYFGRTSLLSAFSAVTAACLVIRKSIFQEVDGLNETDLAVAFNDVDFCLRVRELGYTNMLTPYAELYHYESATRGLDDTPEKSARFNREVEYMKRRWEPLLQHDPAYSPNLSLLYSDFSLAWPPRSAAPHAA
ncbi:glycosyltransferase [Janthinobacterium sp. PC23-8]|uniref:glycosyltransferase n=1 Tax=Janthinobacterium sp. PC23-8 TaxID=2012679 RepID=UPI001C3DA53A